MINSGLEWLQILIYAVLMTLFLLVVGVVSCVMVVVYALSSLWHWDLRYWDETR